MNIQASIDVLKQILSDNWQALLATIMPIGKYTLALIAVIVLAILLRLLVRIILSRVAKNSADFFASITQFSVVIGGLYTIALYAGIDPRVILAIIAIVTAGIAISAENSFAEIMATMKILTSRRLAIGEYVTVAGDIHGVIKEIGLFSTTIQVNSRGLVTLSNRSVADNLLINHDRLGGIEMVVTIPMFDNHDRGKLMWAIKDVMKDRQGVHPGCKVLHNWGGGGEEYAVTFRVIDYSKRRDVSADISMAITNRLVEDGYPVGLVSFVKNV